MNKIVYADYAASAPMREVAKRAYIDALSFYGNPSSAHTAGTQAKVALEKAREKIAMLINCQPSEIYFTSGGTEADNIAVHTGVLTQGNVWCSDIEHHAVLNTVRERWGIPIFNKDDGVLHGTDRYGIFRLPKSFLEHHEDSFLSVMLVNNEVGTVQPIRKIVRAAKSFSCADVIVHTDAVQAIGHIPVDVKNLGVDMLSASAHKFGGPRGIGFLYCAEWLTPEAIMYGGGHEQGIRPGTENVAGAIAMAEALEESLEKMDKESAYVNALRDSLIDGLENVPGFHPNGGIAALAPGFLNCRFNGIYGTALVHMLDRAGICVSAGSACTAGDFRASHVLLAMGLSEEAAYGGVRISLGRLNTMDEVKKIVETIYNIVKGIAS